MCTSQSAASSTSIMPLMHYPRFYISAFLFKLMIAVALLYQTHLVSAGLCREAQLCCNGRDSSCVVQKTPVNAIIEDLNDKPCYCDHACLKLGDCCVDFKDHCGVVDCQVSDWTPWSECDINCGKGITSRTRKVMQAPQNGGKHCPSLIQKKSCQGFRCHGEQGKRLLHETALLTPFPQTQIHNFNRSKESFWFEYCIEFEVIKAAKECHKLKPFNSLIEGDRISVRCNLHEKPIKPNLIRDEIHEKAKNSTIKINVSYIKEKHLEKNSFEADDYSKVVPYSRGANSRMEKVHVTSPVYDKQHKQAVVGRCSGEGVPGRITRWRALAAPLCRGKWLRLTLEVPKRCPHSQFEFF